MPSTVRRKKILVVAPHPPFPLDRGGNIRLWSLCGQLKKTCSFSLVCFVTAELFSDRLAFEALRLRLSSLFDQVHLVPLSAPWPEGFWTRFAEADLAASPLFPALGARIQSALRGTDFDLVHIEHGQMALWRRFVWGPPVVLTEHDVSWVNPARGAGVAGWWRYRRLCRSFQGVVTTGRGDWRWWRRWGPAGVPLALVPTGVDPGRFSFRRKEPSRPPEVLFIGHYDHSPNADAVRFFWDAIWPRVRARMPDVRATFVGANPPSWLKAAARDGGRVTGAVDDVLPYLRRARVFVSPHRLSGGIKGKILEAFASGVPVVASPAALSGFDESVREAVVSADSPEDFAMEVVNLLKNPTANRRTLAARHWVERHHSWDGCARLLDRFYDDVLESSGPSRGRKVFVAPAGQSVPRLPGCR